MAQYSARTRRFHRAVVSAAEGFGDAMRARFPDGTPAMERRLRHAANRVHRMVAAINSGPTDNSVHRLSRAFGALELAGEEARATGIPDDRVTAIVETARTDCLALLFDVLLPLADPDELAETAQRAREARDYR